MKTVLPKFLLAALTLATVGAYGGVPANPFDYSRTNSFAYNADGTLATVTQEPGQPDNCSVKTYTYDHGNVASTSLSNCGGATGRALFPARTLSSATFPAVSSQPILVGGVPTAVSIAPGSAQSRLANALDQAETYQIDPRFNVNIRTSGPNGLASLVAVDDWGRTVRATAPDGTSQVRAYCLLTTSGALDSSQPSNSSGCPSAFAAGEVPAGARLLAHSEPRNTSDAKMGPYQRTYTDFLGRTIRTVTESFDGANQTPGRAASSVVVDTIYDTYGNKVLETQPYFLSSGASSTAGSNAVGASIHQYDFLGRTITSYTSSTTDASSSVNFGSSTGTSYGAYGSQMASKTSVTYAGLTTTSVNDKGQLRIEERAADGSLARVTDALGAQLAYRRDAFGNVVTSVDALQNSSSAQYDYQGNKVVSSDPDKGVTTFCYDANGQLKASQTSQQRGSLTPVACPEVNDSALTATALSGWTTFAYDKTGRMTQRSEAEFVTTNYYDQYADATGCAKGIGKLCEVVTTNGVDRKYAYDAMGRAVAERADIANSGLSFAQSTTYDAATGRKVAQKYPTGLEVGYSYTPLGYMEKLTLNTGASVSPLPSAQGVTAASTTLAAGSALWQLDRVDARGAQEQVSFGNGVIDRRSYSNGKGRPLTVAAGLPASPTSVLSHEYTWDSLDNLTGRSDNNGDAVTGAVTETFSFDGLNRLRQYTVQGSQIPSYSRSVTLNFNALGMLLSKSDVGNFTYNVQGGAQPHGVRTVTSNGGTTFGYDLDGNVISASSGPYAALAYTSFDMVSTASNSGASVRYNWLYDQDHARIRETRTASGNTRTTYYMNPDALGALGFESELDSSPAIQSNRHYLTAYGAPVGVLVSTGALPNLASGQLTPPAPAGGGGLTTIPLASEDTSFTVDGTQTVRYGANSSWFERTVTGTGQCTNDFFGGDPIFMTAKTCELVVTGYLPLTSEGNNFTVAGTQTVRYGAGTTWLTRVVNGTGTCGNDFFGGDPIFGTAKVCQLVAGGGMALNKVEYWERDHLGSLVATTDHTGAVTARYSYDPFGKRRLTNGMYDSGNSLVVDWSPSLNAGSARGFTGHEGLDDIGLVNMNGRLYDGTLGLFVQADPHLSDPQNLQNYNRYSYVLNNPLNATDPSGFDDCDFCGTGYNFGSASFNVPTYFGNYSSYNFSTAPSYGSSSFGTSFGSLGNFTSINLTSQLPSTNNSYAINYSTQAFPGLFDGFAGVGRTTTMLTNSGDWILGRAVGLAVENVTQIAGVAVDLFRAPTNAIVNLLGVPELATNYVSSYGAAVQNGYMSVGSAAYNFGTGPAQSVIQTASEFVNGNWQEASASSLSMFLSPRFAKGENMFNQASAISNWKSPKGTVEGPFSLWAPTADTPITFYHGSPNASFLDKTGFVSNYLSACERGCVSTSTNFSQARTGLSGDNVGVFQYTIPFGEVKAGQLKGSILNRADGPGPESLFKGQSGMDLLNKYRKGG